MVWEHWFQKLLKQPGTTDPQFFSVVLRAAVMLRLFAFAMSIAAMKRQAVQPFSPEQLDLDTLHEKHHISSIELCWA